MVSWKTLVFLSGIVLLLIGVLYWFWLHRKSIKKLRYLLLIIAISFLVGGSVELVSVQACALNSEREYTRFPKAYKRPSQGYVPYV